jgi:protein-S-isoprenylcysteine O-methyltransferase Ste14
MKAAERMIKQGYWLFRYRSYLPLILVIFVMGCLWFYRQIYATENAWFDLSCLLVALCGELIRVLSVGYAPDRTSGRNTKQQVASEINQTGIYSLMRHPLYVGNFFMWFGIALYTRIWWLALIFILIYWLYYERIIMAEENYLEGKFGDEYSRYAEKTPCVIPNFQNYIPNKYCFRIKKVLRQENSSLFGLIFVFLVLEIYQDLIYMSKPAIELHWLIIGAAGIAIYLILRFLKKKTRILHNDKQKEVTVASE